MSNTFWKYLHILTTHPPNGTSIIAQVKLLSLLLSAFCLYQCLLKTCVCVFRLFSSNQRIWDLLNGHIFSSYLYLEGWVPSMSVLFIPTYDKVQSTSPHYPTATFPLPCFCWQKLFKQGELMVFTRYLQIRLQMEFCYLTSYIVCLLWKLLELQLFCSREEENSWRRAQLLCGSSYYANSPGILHISVKGAFLPLHTQNRQLRGQPWSVLSLGDKMRCLATLFPKSHPLGRHMLPYMEGKADPC